MSLFTLKDQDANQELQSAEDKAAALSGFSAVAQYKDLKMCPSRSFNKNICVKSL